MIIKEIVSYLDGGTVEIITDKGIFCVDDRLFTQTKGKLYYGYPWDDNKNIIEDTKSIKDELIKGLSEFNDDEKMDAKKDYVIQLIEENN